MQQFTAKARIQGVVIIYDQTGYTYDDSMLRYDAGIFGKETISSRTRISVKTGQQFTAKTRISVKTGQQFTTQTRISIKTGQQFTTQTRISIKTTRQFTSKARIRANYTKTFLSKAWIRAPRLFTACARVSRQQGWPIPEVAGPGFELWQDTRIYSRVKILHYLAFPTQSLRLKGRITYAKTLGMQARARVVTAQTLQMRANILPKFFTTHVPATFQVQQISQKKLRMVFYIGGDIRNWQFTAKARITQVYGSRVTGHFIVSMPTVFAAVLSIPNPITNARTQQMLSIRAKVVK